MIQYLNHARKALCLAPEGSRGPRLTSPLRNRTLQPKDIFAAR
jgi:hypothetical protein